MLLEKENISNDINVLLNVDEIKVLMLVLELCDSLKIRINKKQYFDILEIFLDYYKTLKDEYKKKMLLKKIMQYVLEENYKEVFNRMKDKNGIGLLFVLLKYKNILSSNTKKLLMNYFHEFRLNKNEYKLLNETIEDEKTKRKIICIIIL